MSLNKEWHLAHHMPKTATLEEPIEWHLKHKKNCACCGLLYKTGKNGERSRSRCP